jgi:hypothetical protein
MIIAIHHDPADPDAATIAVCLTELGRSLARAAGIPVTGSAVIADPDVSSLTGEPVGVVVEPPSGHDDACECAHCRMAVALADMLYHAGRRHRLALAAAAARRAAAASIAARARWAGRHAPSGGEGSDAV